ncbi:hypothetical protein GT348_03780 [Aristophania vespae]|uniref:Uncharacterized protein n=1 Tax=Aristophania vespae TaxID=2697033 RepID=A0A6P1NIL7_9PROT|nr:hypothetical protein [Aristophania vespae]QHI95502.1 hypothetical protein GT348_03780 [Aristophania vespae]
MALTLRRNQNALVQRTLAYQFQTRRCTDSTPEYWDAIMWCLTVRLAFSNEQDASPFIVSLSFSALNIIRTANT